jgi:hypothetical protein
MLAPHCVPSQPVFATDFLSGTMLHPMKGLLVVCSLALIITAAAQQSNSCTAFPAIANVSSSDAAALMAQFPFYLMASQQAGAAPLSCARTRFIPLLPSNLTAGLIISTTAALGGPNGSFVAPDLLGLGQPAAAPPVSEAARWSSQVSEQQDAAVLQRSLAGSAAPQDTVMLPVQGSRWLVGTAEQLQARTSCWCICSSAAHQGVQHEHLMPLC